MSAFFDFPSLLVVLLLFICSSTYIKSLYPTIFDSAPSIPSENEGLTPSHQVEHKGLKGFCWKASRIGERLSPYISIFCIIMAVQVLFFKD